MLPDLDRLAGDSIAAGIQNPDAPYQPARTMVALGPDGTAGSVETNTRLAGGQLASEVVVSVGDTRGVASLKAAICPSEAGKVTATIRLSIIGADDKEHVSLASVLGSVSDQAVLTTSTVNVGTAKGQEASLLTKYGKQLLNSAAAHGAAATA